ncbi:MAG: GDP-L-fucose synthase family protein [bacterium]
MEKDSLIYVAGHRGLAGSAIVNELKSSGFKNLLLKTSTELDLRNQSGVSAFFEQFKPEYVIIAAAKVGGIGANSRFRGQMIYDNLMIQSNIIHFSHVFKVKKLIFLGSSCIYPKLSPQPIKEEYLLTSPLEPTNEPYAIAKIAGLKMCEAYNFEYGTDFITVMPTNLYGENDSFDLENGHVLPVLIRKFHEAKRDKRAFVELWGSGKPKREFLYSKDFAKAVVKLMTSEKKHKTHINIGSGSDITISELAELIKKIVGYSGDIKWNDKMPDGTPRKLLDISNISEIGWIPEVALEEGIRRVYEWYKANHE